MAKDKKTPKEVSDLFGKIIKASVKSNKEEVEEAHNKELDRDIINLNLPEIDWTTPPTGYPKNYTKDSIERRRKEREEGKK